jgi:hypothetical protein
MDDETPGIPIDELHADIYFTGIGLRSKTLELLKDARAYKVAFWRSDKNEVDFFAKRYDKLYEGYMDYDSRVESYTRMCSDPWYRDEETNVMLSKDIDHLSKLNISSDGLLAQRESVRLVLSDVSNQINNLYSELNNVFVNLLGVISLAIALASLVISLVALLK